MKRNDVFMGPVAQYDHLIVTEADRELVVYDQRTSHLHKVPEPIAAVWRCCDGETTVDQIARAVALPPAHVEAALHQLAAARLIKGGDIAPVPSRSRRRFLKRAALGAVIVSVTAPNAAAAASVAPAGRCWWQNAENVWTPMGVDYATCRDEDSCFGGGKQSMGGCWKWTVGQNDRFAGWG